MNYLAATESYFGDRPGGSGRVAWELLKLMRDRGHRAALVCGATDVYSRASTEVVDGIEIARYRVRPLPSWDPRRLSVHVEAVAGAVRRLRSDGWDVVHGHNLGPALGAFRAVSPQTRRIATIHSPALVEQRVNWRYTQGVVGWLKLAVGQPLLRRAEQTLYGQAHAVSALSRYTIEEMARVYGPHLLGRKVTLIPWWAEPTPVATVSKAEARRRLGWTDGTVFFSLRRHVPRMGLDTLLAAVARLPLSLPFSIVIAGDGSSRAALEAQAQANPHRNRIRFLGRITDEEAELAYRGADVFVLPTRLLECFGIIALEAMGRGLPVIASRVGALPEVIGPILRDWMFEPGDAAELSRRMTEFIRADRAIPTPEALGEYVQARYTKERVAGEYIRWIESGIAGASRS